MVNSQSHLRDIVDKKTAYNEGRLYYKISKFVRHYLLDPPLALAWKSDMTLGQGWATLFDSRATLVTNLFYSGQYKYHKDLFKLTFERKQVFRSPVSK